MRLGQGVRRCTAGTEGLSSREPTEPGLRSDSETDGLSSGVAGCEAGVGEACCCAVYVAENSHVFASYMLASDLTTMATK